MAFNFHTSYLQLSSKLYELVAPPSVADPKIVLLNNSLLDYLGVEYSSEDLPKKLLGVGFSDKLLAQAYAGHQFGYFTILGDGRAMLLGEHITKQNERYDIQLKGSGITKYSRRGDGKATLSSMIREYLYSGAMKNLGIKTSQSLAVISTGDAVYRTSVHEGAILVRVMESQIRFGTFEYVAKVCSKEEFIEFTDYVIQRHYPHLVGVPDRYIELFRGVMDKTIEMVVNWYRVGFIHGVMNTDNMSIAGESFDYGPCSFINGFDLSTTFSRIDTQGRYSFGNQKSILFWNLQVFGKTLLPFLSEETSRATEILNLELEMFNEKFDSCFYEMMKKKLGISKPGNFENEVNSVLQFLLNNKADFTNTFLELMYPNSFEDSAFKSKEFRELRSQIKEVGLDLSVMIKNNPRYILRNYLVEEALEEYEQKQSPEKVNQLLDVISYAYDETKHFRTFQIPPPQSYDEMYTTHCNT